ncbi:MAG: S1C family serine protease, partial [Burkholderiaceae bacterium]
KIRLVDVIPPPRAGGSRPAATAPSGRRHRRRPALAAIMASALVAGGAGLSMTGAVAQADPRPSAADGVQPRGDRGRAMIDRPGPADRTFLNDTVVRLETKAVADAESSRSLGQRRSGTGVLIDNSTVLTIGYLLLEADEVEMVTPSGKHIPGSVAGYDPVSGFGLVRSAVPLDGRPLEFGDSDAIGEKERVLTLGHGEPEATELLVVSRKEFTGSWEYQIDSGIFTFPPVNNWSGAALVDRGGKLVGIGSLIVNDAATVQRGVPGNLYVPVNLLKPILADLLATGRRSGPAQPWLGLSTEVVQGNLMVSRVTSGGPADRAGLAAGDIIVAVDGEKVGSQSDFYRIIWKKGPAGVTVPLRVLKSGDVREVAVQSRDRMDSLRKPSGI